MEDNEDWWDEESEWTKTNPTNNYTGYLDVSAMNEQPFGGGARYHESFSNLPGIIGDLIKRFEFKLVFPRNHEELTQIKIKITPNTLNSMKPLSSLLKVEFKFRPNANKWGKSKECWRERNVEMNLLSKRPQSGYLWNRNTIKSYNSSIIFVVGFTHSLKRVSDGDIYDALWDKYHDVDKIRDLKSEFMGNGLDLSSQNLFLISPKGEWEVMRDALRVKPYHKHRQQRKDEHHLDGDK